MEIEIKCHKQENLRTRYRIEWKPADPPVDANGLEGRPFRTCSYCGSMHPEDMLAALRAGAQLQGSDWKHGWPNKLYVFDIPNPATGTPAIVSHTKRMKNGEWFNEPVWGEVGKTTHGRWYNRHFFDLSPEDFEEITDEIHKQIGLRFVLDDDGLYFLVEGEK